MQPLSTAECLKTLFYLFPEIRSTFAFPYLDRRKIEAWQFSVMKRLLSFSYRNIPFYKRKYSEARIEPEDIKNLSDFSKLPFVTKQELIDNYPNLIVSPEIDLRKSIVSLTSGSSGKVASVVYGPKELAKYMLAGIRSYGTGMPWRPWYRQFSIYTSEHPLKQFLGRYWLRYMNTLTTVEEIATTLLRTAPDFLNCYPSLLRELTNYLTGRKIAFPKLKAIYINSEESTAREREEWARFWGCGIYDEYSSEELNRIATQCRFGTYHLWEDLNYIEIVNDDGSATADGEVGEVIGTHLVNFALPLIRYRQGDRAAIIRKRCGCGRQLKSLEKLQGRANHEFLFSGGRKIASGVLLDLAYAFLLENANAICDFCIIQETRTKVRVEILPGNNYSEAVNARIKNTIKPILPDDVELEVAAVKVLYKTRAGKKNPIIRLGA